MFVDLKRVDRKSQVLQDVAELGVGSSSFLLSMKTLLRQYQHLEYLLVHKRLPGDLFRRHYMMALLHFVPALHSFASLVYWLLIVDADGPVATIAVGEVECTGRRITIAV